MPVSVFASGGHPDSCRRGHPWGPGQILVGWTPCLCPNAAANGKGHHWVRCETAGCGEVWTDPPHAPEAGT